MRLALRSKILNVSWKNYICFNALGSLKFIRIQKHFEKTVVFSSRGKKLAFRKPLLQWQGIPRERKNLIKKKVQKWETLKEKKVGRVKGKIRLEEAEKSESDGARGNGAIGQLWDFLPRWKAPPVSSAGGSWFSSDTLVHMCSRPPDLPGRTEGRKVHRNVLMLRDFRLLFFFFSK